MKQENENKAYLFNLIFYTHEKKRSDYFHSFVQPFIEKYPCRAIFIQSHLDQDGENGSNLSEKQENGDLDIIEIKVTKSQLHKVPFLLLPKLIPDLPIYLVWGQNPTSHNEILPQLEKLATRFVFDSECASNLQEFGSTMLEKIKELKIEFMDISWANISGWRDVIAQTFKTSERWNYFQQCKRLLIKFNQLNSTNILHPSLQAIFLQGWLAAQAGWKFQKISNKDGIIINYQASNSGIEVILKPQERQSLSPGRVFEVEFDGPNEVKTILTLAEKQSKVMVYVSNPEKCELPFSHPIPDMTKGITAMKEVFYYKASSHYRNMLDVIKNIPWKGF